MIGRLLCWAGWHKWRYSIGADVATVGSRVRATSVLRQCHRRDCRTPIELME